MKAIIHKPTGQWVQFIEQDWGTCNVPQLYPNTSSLEGIKEFNKRSYDHDLDITDLEMIDVVIVTKSEYNRLITQS